MNMDHGGMMLKGLNTLGLGLSEANFPLLTESYLVMWELVRQGAGMLTGYLNEEAVAPLWQFGALSATLIFDR
ncbi:MAG: hypothetical protein ACI9TA_002445 [Reinekea sp.]